jgi:hypothetical protein
MVRQGYFHILKQNQMKKLVIATLVAFATTTSFVSDPPTKPMVEAYDYQGYTFDEPLVNAEGREAGDQILFSFDMPGGGHYDAVSCPGTGVACVIYGKAADGDPTYYASLKGKGRANVELVYVP